MAKFEWKPYEEGVNDVRMGIRVPEGVVYILYLYKGMGLDILEEGNHGLNEDVFWRSGEDEIIAVYETRAEAEAHMASYPALPDFSENNAEKR